MEYPSLIVIENSANCNFRCEACPTVHARFYPKKFMDMEIFDKILNRISLSIFTKCALVGWGEPFLDPTYFQKLAKLKQAGYLVGSTSNLSMLTEKIIRNIMEFGLDQLQISLDVHHLRAANISLNEYLKKMTILFENIVRHSSSLRVGVNIIAFRSHIAAIDCILGIIKDFPLFSIGIAPLIMIPSEFLYQELVSKYEFMQMKNNLLQKYPNMPISFQYLEDRVSGCRSDVFQNVYVNYEGYVNPCCMLAMEFPNMTFEGQLGTTRFLDFGCVSENSFENIWNSDDYMAFRQAFADGRLHEYCNCCNSWRILR